MFVKVPARSSHRRYAVRQEGRREHRRGSWAQRPFEVCRPPRLAGFRLSGRHFHPHPNEILTSRSNTWPARMLKLG